MFEEADTLLQIITDSTTINKNTYSLLTRITHLEKTSMALIYSFNILNTGTHYDVVLDSKETLKMTQVLSKNTDLRYLKAAARKDANVIGSCP